MPFDNLPPQPPIYPSEAAEFAEEALSLSRAAARQCATTLDVNYGDDYWQAIDIYCPLDRFSAGLPVLLFAHGGAWTHGYKEWCGMMAPAITAFPAIFVSVSYRLAPENRFPCAYLDCIAALKWVYENIQKYGGDAERLFVSGHSAGGHLYSLIALRSDGLKDARLPDNIIKGCFPLSSQLNLVFDNPEPGTGEARIYEKFLAKPSDAFAASPLHYVDSSTKTPFVLAYGSKDFPRIVQANKIFHKKMIDCGLNVTLHVFENYDHFDTALQVRHPNNSWTMMIRDRMTHSD